MARAALLTRTGEERGGLRRSREDDQDRTGKELSHERAALAVVLTAVAGAVDALSITALGVVPLGILTVAVLLASWSKDMPLRRAPGAQRYFAAAWPVGVRAMG